MKKRICLNIIQDAPKKKRLSFITKLLGMTKTIYVNRAIENEHKIQMKKLKIKF